MGTTRRSDGHLYSASQLLSSIITFGPQPNKAVGAQRIRILGGIHQDAYLKERRRMRSLIRGPWECRRANWCLASGQSR